MDLCQVVNMRFFTLSFCFIFFLCNNLFATEHYNSWNLNIEEKQLHQTFQKYLQAKKYEKAKTFLIKNKKKYSLLFYRRQFLEILFLQKKERELLNLATKWIDQTPENANYLFLRALFLYRLDYQISALENFYLAYKKNKQTSDIIEFLYYYYQSLQYNPTLLTTANRLLEQILMLQPTSEIWFEKAKLEISLKKYKESYLSVLEAIKLEDKKDYYNQLLVLERSFYPNNYPITLIKTLELYPNDIHFYRLYTELQKTPEQKKLWEKKLIAIIQAKEQEQFSDLASFYLLLAKLQEKLGRASALKNYRKSVELNPSNAALLALANILWEQNQKTKAVEYFHLLYKKEEKNIFIFFALGSYYKENNQPYSAEEFILVGLEHYPNNSSLLHLYSQILEIQSRYSDAIEVVQELLKIEKEHPDLLRKIGYWYTKQKNYQKAEVYLKRSLAIKKSDLSYYRLASNYYQQNKQTAALNTLQRDFQSLNLLPFIYSLKAEIYFQQEKYKNALEYIQKSIELKKKQSDKITNFAKNLEIQSLLYLGSFDLARQKIEIYSEQELTKFLRKQKIILEFIQQKEPKKKLLTKIQNYLQKEPLDSFLLEIFYYLQEEKIFWEWKNKEQEVYRKILFYQFQEAENLLAKLPKSSQKKFLRYLLSKIKNNSAQLEDIKTENFWQSYYLAKYYLETAELEKAAIFIKKSIAQNPNFSWSYVLQGDIYSKQKHYKKAILVYQKFLEYFPLNLSALKNLAIAYDFSKQHQNAKTIYFKIIQNYPTEELALNNLAWLYLTKFSNEKNNKKALQLSKKAVQISTNAANLDTLAEAHYQNGNYQEALKLIEQSLILDSENLDHFKQQKIKFLEAFNEQTILP